MTVAEQQPDSWGVVVAHVQRRSCAPRLVFAGNKGVHVTCTCGGFPPRLFHPETDCLDLLLYDMWTHRVFDTMATA